MSNDEPTFTYSSKDMEDLARDKAAKDAARAAIASEARAHQWEHKQPAQRLGQATGVGLQTTGRTFTREEVLTVLRSKKAEMHPDSHSAELIDRLVRIFERME